MKKTWLLAAGLALALAGTVTINWVRHSNARRQIEARAVPLPPDLSQAAPELRSRIAQATEQATGGRRDVDALAELSRLYHANGFLAEAVRCYEGLELLQPGEPRWLHRHATILAGYGDIEPAVTLWQRGLALDPSYRPARLRLGDAFLKSNQPEQAAAAYENVLQRQPENPYALLGLARIDWEMGRFEPARQRLERVVQLTDFQLGYDLIVTVYERLGQNAQAQAIRGTAKASGAYRDPVDPWMDALFDDCYDPYRLSLAAGSAERNRDVDTAIRWLEQAIRLAPGEVSARFQLGGLQLRRGDSKSAVQHYTKCTALAPDFADGWIHLADVLDQMGDSLGASRTVLTGLNHCPDSPGLHLARARQLRRGKQAEAAIEEFKKSIRLRSNEPEAYLELGNLYIETDRITEGVEQLQKALAAVPEHPAALGTLAFHAILTGDEAEARQWLGRVKRQPRVPAAQAAHLDAAYRKAFGRDFSE